MNKHIVCNYPADPAVVAFQGSLGAYSDLACRSVFPHLKTLPCATFEDAFAAVRDKVAGVAMIPIENSVAGRVADIHHLLPSGGLHIIGEHYQPVQHHLLALPGAKPSDIREVHSHVQALSQCRKYIHKHKMKPVVKADTAGSAEEIAKLGDHGIAAIASSLAGELYGLNSLAHNIADSEHNTTRFLLLSREGVMPQANGDPVVTSIFFRVRSVPAALYKALGGFATNGINITKLESYLVDGKFTAAQFYADVEGHPEDKGMRHALEELGFFAHEVKILGVYPAHPFRLEKSLSVI